jgi:DedD protein
VESRPAPEPVIEEPDQEAPAQTATAEASSTGMWAVQLGSFSSQENAERLAAELRKQGHAAFLSQVTTANGQLHRVRVGPQADRAAADAVAEQLRREGHDVKVLPHP